MLSDCYLDLLLNELFIIALPQIHGEWRVVADYLDYPPAVVQAIYLEGKYCGSLYYCVEFFKDWYHSDNGVKPCSWGALVAALRHPRFGEISNQIEKGLVKSMCVHTYTYNALLFISFLLLYTDPKEIYLLVHGQYLILSKVRMCTHVIADVLKYPEPQVNFIFIPPLLINIWYE